MQVTLKLIPRHTRQPLRKAVAWFVSGGDPSTWLRELNRSGLPLESIQLRPIPRSFHENSPIGVLVTPGHTGQEFAQQIRSHSQNAWSQSGKALAYGLVAGRLFVPIDSRLFPDVSDVDVTQLLPADDSEFVWHPSTGLLRMDSPERLRVDELFVPPDERIAVWDKAIPGTAFRSRVISIQADNELTADSIVQQGRGDIGQRSASPDQLPPTPGEWFKGRLGQWAKSLREALTPRPRLPTDKPADQLGSAARSSILGAVGSVAAALLSGGLGLIVVPLMVSGSALGKGLRRTGLQSFVDQIARNREIDRLMHLLKNDPDQGLQYAFSVGSGENRGKADPTNQLGARNASFDLDRLKGGGPADYWNLSRDHQMQLIQQYRELAVREIRLGRHRRAAYIFAELLSDYLSAAGTLEGGGHYRDAAILYRDHLKRPLEAAKCMERAGLLDEAALLYLEANMIEAAADLYLRLDRRDEAERLFRLFAENLIDKGDFQNASRIRHDKLHDVDGALTALAKGWPHSTMAQECLRESFVLLGLHARHEAAQKLVDDLRGDRTIDRRIKPAAHVLSEVALDYPEALVRLAAADATQVIVSRGLVGSSPQEARGLLDSVRRIVPHDLLLKRDCERYVLGQQKQSQTNGKLTATRRGIKLVHDGNLPLRKIDWQVAKSTGGSVYLAGYGQGSLVLQRLEWNRLSIDDVHAVWPVFSELSSLILDPYPQDQGPAILHQIGAEFLAPRRFTGGQERWDFAGSPSWATKSTVAMAYEPGGAGWRVRRIFSSLELSRTNPQGESTVITDLLTNSHETVDINAAVTLRATNRKKVLVGVGDLLCRLLTKDTSGVMTTVCERFPSPIHQLAGYQSDSAEWLLVLFETGAILIDEKTNSRFPVATELDSPSATFLPAGQLVMAGDRSIRVYEISQSRPVMVGSVPIDFTPISVTSTDKVSEFAVFGGHGEFRIFSIVL